MGKIEQKPLGSEIFNSEQKLMKLALKILNEQRKKILPEYEYVVSASALFVYLSFLLKYSIYPQQLQQLEELMWKISDRTLIIAIVITFAGVIDGAQRVVNERVPYYQEFVRVFLLGKELRGGQ